MKEISNRSVKQFKRIEAGETKDSRQTFIFFALFNHLFYNNRFSPIRTFILKNDGKTRKQNKSSIGISERFSVMKDQVFEKQNSKVSIIKAYIGKER